MNIPLDRLYHYIQNIAEKIYGDRIIIYRFWPYGSKNIDQLSPLCESENSMYETSISPIIWCYDQEPLDFKYYEHNKKIWHDPWGNLLKSIGMSIPPKNFNFITNLFEKNLLLHSEQRSKNLELYNKNNELIPVYYWSHALIARDWFRYAENDRFQKNVKKPFLIYNRAWSGTREYRLKFSELMISMELIDYCQMSINAVEPELLIHNKQHKFINPIWKPKHVLENYFPTNTAPSHYSADFDTNDYNSTDIEVVLETLFDDDRLQLTEKSLRPMACAQPFILASAHGSLEYLRGYGFKTFSDVWDESYDGIEDPEERLFAIANLMKQIVNWPAVVRERKIAEARAVAEYNQQWFFSQPFFSLIVDELKTNLELAFKEQQNGDNYTAWINKFNELLKKQPVVEFLENNQFPGYYTKADMDDIMRLALQKKKKI